MLSLYVVINVSQLWFELYVDPCVTSVLRYQTRVAGERAGRHPGPQPARREAGREPGGFSGGEAAVIS